MISVTLGFLAVAAAAALGFLTWSIINYVQARRGLAAAQTQLEAARAALATARDRPGG